MAARSNRALFVMDLGVPRNVDPDAANLYNLYVYNIDDLTEIVDKSQRRESEIPRANSSSKSTSANSSPGKPASS